MNKNQNGFGVIEFLLVSITLIIVSALGFTFYQKEFARTNTLTEIQSIEQTNEVSDSTKQYTNQNLGIYFEYPSEWGEVQIEDEDLYKGEGYRLSFSKKPESQASIRNKDYELAPEGSGRGGAYWDSPRLFNNAWPGDEPWNEDYKSSDMLIEQSDTLLVYAQCSDFTASATIDAHVKLNGEKFDTAKFFYLVRAPKDDGSGIDLSECKDIKKLVEPVQTDYLQFIKTIRPL